MLNALPDAQFHGSMMDTVMMHATIQLAPGTPGIAMLKTALLAVTRTGPVMDSATTPVKSLLADMISSIALNQYQLTAMTDAPSFGLMTDSVMTTATMTIALMMITIVTMLTAPLDATRTGQEMASVMMPATPKIADTISSIAMTHTAPIALTAAPTHGSETTGVTMHATPKIATGMMMTAKAGAHQDAQKNGSTTISAIPNATLMNAIGMMETAKLHSCSSLW